MPVDKELRNKYALNGSLDFFQGEILPACPHWHYTTIDSTNQEAIRLISKQPLNRALISADSQTSGRGQYGRKFYSPPNGLYFSIIWGADYLTIERDLKTVLRVALGLARELEVLKEALDGPQAKHKLRIKQLNDIYMDGRKIAGILCERYHSHLIVGIGINLYAQDFPADLQGRAGYLLTSEQSVDQRFYKRLITKLQQLLFNELNAQDLQEFQDRLV
ncbi:MAG: biotin--[acetyl-CoA-carboxylase] ligase [Eubacteriales bacterium]|nr:biotin--[acetyl-CoA-carboxylase] ligase [Eubacteriales bacterium]